MPDQDIRATDLRSLLGHHKRQGLGFGGGSGAGGGGWARGQGSGFMLKRSICTCLAVVNLVFPVAAFALSHNVRA